MTKIYTLSNGNTIKVHLQKKGESNSFFGNSNSWHDVYRVIMDFGNGKKFITTFHNSVSEFCKPVTEDTIDCAVECIINDFMAYENHSYEEDFFDTFGYNRQAYNGCRSIYERLSELVDYDVITEIYNIIYDEDENFE